MIFHKKHKINTEHPKGSLIKSKYHLLVFILSFAITGGVLLLLSTSAAVIYTSDPGHASKCIENRPKDGRTTFRPGENFTATVRIQNTGTTYFAGDFGMGLGDLNYAPAVWNASGTDLSGNVGPGGVAAFNLNLKAPATPGAYRFEWGVGIAFNGFIRDSCTGTVITVANPPAPTPTPTPTPSPTPAPTPSPGTTAKPPTTSSTPRTTTKPSGTNRTTTTTPSSPVVTTPPPTPTDFSGKATDDSTVQLSWKSSVYAGTLLGYELERSKDTVTWEKITTELVADEVFTDTDIKYETTYNYRVRAVGQNDLKSEFATTTVTTNPFESNTSDGESVLTSEDQRVNVYIPDSAIEGDAQCSLRNDNDLLAPTKDKFEPFAGPYQILCKKADGALIGNFKSAVRVTINNEKSGYSKLAYFSYASDWQEVEGKLEDNTGSFEIQDQTSFAVLGQKSSTPLWLKIIIAIIVLGVTIIGGLRLLYFIKNKQAQNDFARKNEDYYHKEHGI